MVRFARVRCKLLLVRNPRMPVVPTKAKTKLMTMTKTMMTTVSTRVTSRRLMRRRMKIMMMTLVMVSFNDKSQAPYPAQV